MPQAHGQVDRLDDEPQPLRFNLLGIRTRPSRKAAVESRRVEIQSATVSRLPFPNETHYYYIVSLKHIHRLGSVQPVLWGRMASCAAIGNRRSSRSYTGSGRPIANRPQINNLPRRAA